MEITVSSRHTEVSDALRSTTEDKIARLTRFLEGMDRAEVHFSEERNPRITDKEICEVTLEGHGHHVRAKVAAPDGFVAVDRAVEKLEHQLHKLKTRLLRRSHSGARRTDGAVPPVDLGGVIEDLGAGDGSGHGPGGDGSAHRADGAPPGATGEVAGGPRIVKTKAFDMKPMAPEEAALQMDLLGHTFFFFSNAETGRAAVVYCRDDGDVGLIDDAG